MDPITVVFAVLTVISLIVCTGIIIDRVLFSKNIKKIDYGMTGREIEALTGLKLHIINLSVVNTNDYEAIVTSKATIFKYTLIFKDGKLYRKKAN